MRYNLAMPAPVCCCPCYSHSLFDRISQQEVSRKLCQIAVVQPLTPLCPPRNAPAMQHEADARRVHVESAAEQQLSALKEAAQAAQAAADARVAALVRGLRARYFRDPAPAPHTPGAGNAGGGSGGRTPVSRNAVKTPGRPPSGAQRRLSPTPEVANEDDASSSPVTGDGSAASGLGSSTLSTLCRLGADEVMDVLEAFISRQAAALERQASSRDAEGTGDPAAQPEDQQVVWELLWLEGSLLLVLAELRQQERECEALRLQLLPTPSTPGLPSGAPSSAQPRLASARSQRSSSLAAATSVEAAGSGAGGNPARSLAAQMMRAMAAERSELQRRVARLEASASQARDLSRTSSTSLWASSSGSAHGHPQLHQGRDTASYGPPSAPFTHYAPLRRSLSARSAASSASANTAPTSPGLASTSSATLAAAPSQTLPTVASPRNAHSPATSGLSSQPQQSPGPAAASAATAAKHRRCSEPSDGGSPSSPTPSRADLDGPHSARDCCSPGVTPRHAVDSPTVADAVTHAWVEVGGAGLASQFQREGCLSSIAPPPQGKGSGRQDPATLQPGEHGRPSSGSPLKASYDVDDVMAILEGIGDALPSMRQGQGGVRTQQQQQYRPVGLGGSLLGPTPSLLPGRKTSSPRLGTPAWDGWMQVLSSGEGVAASGAATATVGAAVVGRGSLLVGGRGNNSRQLTPYLSRQRKHSVDGLRP